MDYSRRSFLQLMAMATGTVAVAATGAGTMASLVGCSTANTTKTRKAATGALALSNDSWNYDATNDVYWKTGVVYCEKPAANSYESMGLYVPGAYFTGTKNADGTYACTVNEKGSVGTFTADTAPIVFPVNTAGYSAQAAPTSYSYNSIADYLAAGFVYAYAGLRGRDNGYNSDGSLAFSGGAPWGVTDLKAAIRFYRYNAGTLPGDTDKVFTFGHSGGGAQSALAGATGDSALYEPYLNAIGAAMKDDSGNALSDALCGAMCWCPITSLDYADEAYEWNMGQYATSGTRADGTWTKVLSNDLSSRFATYINALGLKDAKGNTLALEASSSGIYAAGSYYDYLVGVVEESLNNFLADTTFPYTPSSTTMADGGFGGGMTGGSDSPTGGTMDGSSLPSGSLPDSSGGSLPDASGTGGTSGMRMGGLSSQSTDSTTYATVQDYLASLNSDTEWIAYDASTNTAKISSLGAFITHCKNASKDVCAFDSLERSQAENNLFGNDASESLHFDPTIADLLQNNGATYAAYSGYDASYTQAYASDLATVDSLGTDMETRVSMYNPMYYLCDYYAGNGKSTLAKHWRIRTGIDQGDTALTVETNLALALQKNKKVSDVDFATVWGLAHTTAERTGTSTANFISWVEGF